MDKVQLRGSHGKPFIMCTDAWGSHGKPFVMCTDAWGSHVQTQDHELNINTFLCGNTMQPYTLTYMGNSSATDTATVAAGFTTLNFILQSDGQGNEFQLARLVFPVSVAGFHTVRNIRLNGTYVSASYDVLAKGSTFKITGFPVIINPASIAAASIPVTFEVPSALGFNGFFVAPVFATYSGNGQLCPIAFIQMSAPAAGRLLS
ncbi:hypothetical protein CEUSTIGMA_g4494.t1 [Chlamydomonas eustigma]|uniref:Uncharacterized protein n=1 Tax=Chlamydomonas eustigma TaxID=1157962 RepID=A0A250X1V2_9CHLO|nr:hypothetical protein CEUSTIGMA_g4494.t1 [Chlamydomonas eustigma]|eukprot:GAX77048.1 hypothetical protein CEUSTIGMA_g4494.t1 [Chlamydomonas eustigma]